MSPIASRPTPQSGVRNVSSRRIRWRITTRVDRPSLMRFFRCLTATFTLVVTVFLTLVLLFCSLSVALGPDASQQAIVRERIAHARRAILQTGASMELPTAAAVRSADLRTLARERRHWTPLRFQPVWTDVDPCDIEASECVNAGETREHSILAVR